MHSDAGTFLREEREAWRPYEALARLPDTELDLAVGAAHGWSARDLIAHLVYWHSVSAVVARELAEGSSRTLDENYELDDATVDALNDRTTAAWRELPVAEIRRRFASIPADFRAALAALPEARWLGDERAYNWMLWNSLEHYEGHAGDLAAILAAAGRPPVQA